MSINGMTQKVHGQDENFALRKSWELQYGDPRPVALHICPSFIHGIIDTADQKNGLFRLRQVSSQEPEEKFDQSNIRFIWVVFANHVSSNIERLHDGTRVNANLSELSSGAEIEFVPFMSNAETYRSYQSPPHDVVFYADHMLLISGTAQTKKTVMLDETCQPTEAH
jgi:hypothetical protein